MGHVTHNLQDKWLSDGRFVIVTASRLYGNNESKVTQTSHRDP